jgi:hypothetical protein
MGVNKILRTIVKNIKPRLIISEKDGKWSFKSETTFKKIAYEFVPGVEFEDVAPDGQHIQVRRDF